MIKNVRPFVKPGELLGFARALQERGLWPPRLHDRKDRPNDRQPTATPFLVVPVTTAPADDGSRPKPNSKTFHSKGVWIEDSGGAVVAAPVVGGVYRVKCRVRNLGAFPAYAGMADFFVNKPGTFTAAAGTTTTLPSLGHTGFSLLVGEEKVIACPNPWSPATAAELSDSLVVHAYDPFADNLVSRFDARHDRHVGRHDLTPDLYVRDWTDSATVHDDGIEPSSHGDFYVRSDVWNRRAAAAGSFVNDQPQNQSPQQGNGAAGDNVIFARVSRNEATVAQTVRAHFLFAEFGTGSPFVDCAAGPDPAVTLAPGVFSGIVSLPWRLHPSSSTHLCIAAQIYDEGDPYTPPGLLGYTPGWPTTDMMVINDNNKAQRNIGVWDAMADAEGMFFGIVFNAATFVRDVTLRVGGSEGMPRRFTNARLSVPVSGVSQEFQPGASLVLKQMLPGERRWVGFSYDRAALTPDGGLRVSFDEVVGDAVVNGFAFDLRGIASAAMVLPVLTFQAAVFYRLAEGMAIGTAKEGLTLCQRLIDSRPTLRTYADAVPAIARLMTRGLTDMSAAFGVRDLFGVSEGLDTLATTSERDAAPALARHNRLLHQVDALQTMAVKSRGDRADILFTLRLQREVYRSERLAAAPRVDELLRATETFVHEYPQIRDAADRYLLFVRSQGPVFEATLGLLGVGAVRARHGELLASLAATPEAVQKAHLNYLNAVLIALDR